MSLHAPDVLVDVRLKPVSAWLHAGLSEKQAFQAWTVMQQQLEDIVDQMKSSKGLHLTFLL